MKRPSKILLCSCSIGKMGKTIVCLLTSIARKNKLGKSKLQKIVSTKTKSQSNHSYPRLICGIFLQPSACLSGNRNILGKISRKKGKNLGQKEGEERTRRLMWPQKGQKESLLRYLREEQVRKKLLFRSGISASSQRRKKNLSLTSMSED